MVMKPRVREVLTGRCPYEVHERLWTPRQEANWQEWKCTPMKDFIAAAAFRGGRLKEISKGYQ